MKKLLALIFALILLAGCSGQNHSSEATGASDAPAPSAPASASETTVPVTPTTEYTTAPTTDTQAESSETKPYCPTSFWKEEKQENGETRIILPETIENETSLYILGGKMYISCQNLGEFGLAVFDTGTGELLDFYSLGEGFIQGLDENAFQYWTSDGSAYFISREEPIPFLLKLPEHDGRYFYFSDRSFLLEDSCTLGELDGFDKNGERQFHASLGSAFTFSPICKTNGLIYAAADFGQGVCLVSIHSDNGNWENLGFFGSTAHGSFRENIMVCDDSTGCLVVWDKNGTIRNSFPLAEPYCYITSCNDKYVAVQGSLYTVVFDLEGNVRYAEKNPQDDSSQIIICQLDGDFLYTMRQPIAKNEPMEFTRRDLNDYPPVELETALGIPLYPDGITILTGEEADLFTPSYKCEPVYDEAENKRAYGILFSIVEQFPDGFFEELLGSDCAYNSLVFRYVDHLYGIEANTLESAGGLSYQEGRTQYICITRNMIDEPSLIFHEIMHCIESCMESRGIYFDGWNDYLPESFFYSYDYSNVADHTFTDPWESDPENVWFPSSYSKITPAEDRADLFGLMMTDNPYYFQFPHIAERAGFLAAVLKETFPSLGSCPHLS